MAGEGWKDATFYDEEGQIALAQVRYCLRQDVDADGSLWLSGSFTLREELCPLHTGIARLCSSTGETWPVWIQRISRPRGDGEFQVLPADEDLAGPGQAS